jgi:hypothetical protein
LLNFIETLSWIRAVPDNVAKTEDFCNSALANILQHYGECFKIPVNVADERSLHDRCTLKPVCGYGLRET